MQHHAQIVIGLDGTILAATGQPLPPRLLDTRLDDCDQLPLSVRAAGTAALQQLRDSGERIVSQTVVLDDREESVQVLAIDAIAIRRAATNVQELLTSKLAVIASQADAQGVTLSVKVAEDVQVVHLDSEKIAWAVTTLVGNALRYVQAPSRRLGGRAIVVRATFDPALSQVAISVQDDGPGIPSDTVSRLFVRDGLNVRGAGLSLLLIRDIMVAHGGTGDIRSNTDPSSHGTTVRLTFPTP